MKRDVIHLPLADANALEGLLWESLIDVCERRKRRTSARIQAALRRCLDLDRRAG